MSKPILSKTVSINGLIKGQPWAYQPVSTSGGPVSAWTALGLPAGITLNTTTGRISGIPEVPGVYNVTIRARDASSVFSDPLIFPVGVETQAVEASGSIRINVNLQTGQVYSPDNNANVPLFVKSGDQLQLAIGFEDGGILQPIPMMGLINVTLKVYDTEHPIPLNDGGFLILGDYDTTRYLTVLDLASDSRILQAFDDFETDHGTGFIGLAEINWTWFDLKPGYGSTPQPFSRSTRSFPLTTFRELK